MVPVAVLHTSDLAVPALVLYLAGYAVANVGAFAVVAAVPALTTLRGYGGLAGRDPRLGAALTVVTVAAATPG